MATKSAPFSVRLDVDVERRLFEVVAATEGEVSRGEVVNMALELLFSQLRVCPAMIPGYDPDKDASVTQRADMSYKKGGM